MPRSKRASARRTMLAHIKDMRANLETLKHWWTAETTVFDGAEALRGGRPFRERQLDEYPENQTRYWLGTIGELDDLAEKIARARSYAIQQHNITKDLENGR